MWLALMGLEVVTRILAVVLLASLAGSGAAWSKTLVRRAHAPRIHAMHITAHRAPRRAAHRPHAPRVSMHHRSRLAALAASQSDEGQPRDTTRFEEAAAGPSGRAGLFRGQHQAGWGFDNGRMTTVVGLYQRPEQPDAAVPANQVYHHDGRGAAGLSLSFKLGQ